MTPDIHKTPYIKECQVAEEAIRVALVEAGINGPHLARALVVLAAKWFADNVDERNKALFALARAANPNLQPIELVMKSYKAEVVSFQFLVTMMTLLRLTLPKEEDIWQCLNKAAHERIAPSA